MNRSIAILALFAASACNAPNEVGAETIDGVTFLPPSAVYDIYAANSLACENYRESDGTCTSVEAKSLVTQDAIHTQGITLSDDGGLKMVVTSVSHIKGKFLCGTIDEAAITARTAYLAANTQPKITAEDIRLTGEQQDAWHQGIRQQVQHLMGQEICWRYSVVSREPNGDVEIAKMHTFVDGVEQVSANPTTIKFFTPESELTLRTKTG